MTARKLDPAVEAMHEDLLRRSTTYRIADAVRCAGRPMTTAEIAEAAGASRKTIGGLLTRLVERGHLRRVRWGVYVSPVPRHLPTPAKPTPLGLPERDAAGRRVLMVLGSGDRREGCTRYEWCLDVATRITSAPVRCPARCPHFAARDSRISREDALARHDTRSEYVDR